MSIIVTGASGRLGRLATNGLKDLVPPSELILTTRDPDALADAPKGASVRAADFETPESLASAFEGGTRMLLIGTHGRMERVAMHTGVIEAAKRAGVAHISFVSFCNPVRDNPMFVSESNLAIEEALQESGLTWTLLHDFIYSDLRVDLAPFCLMEGKVVTNITSGSHAFIWREDCAAVAAASVADGRHENEVYDVTGPQMLSTEDYRDLLVEFGGRDVEIVVISDEEHLKYGEAFQQRFGLPTWMPELHTSTGIAIREGYMDGLTSVVEEVTGRKPRTMRELFELRRDDIRPGPPIG